MFRAGNMSTLEKVRNILNEVRHDWEREKSQYQAIINRLQQQLESNQHDLLKLREKLKYVFIIRNEYPLEQQRNIRPCI